MTPAPTGEDFWLQPVSSLILFVEYTVPRSQRWLAGLVGVPERTWQQWLSGDAEPGPRHDRALRSLANTLNVLLTCTTEEGRVGWLSEPNKHLDRQRPADVLREPGQVGRLVAAARAERDDLGARPDRRRFSVSPTQVSGAVSGRLQFADLNGDERELAHAIIDAQIEVGAEQTRFGQDVRGADSEDPDVGSEV